MEFKKNDLFFSLFLFGTRRVSKDFLNEGNSIH